MSKIDFRLLARQLMFDLTAEELSSVENDFELLIQQLALLDAIDTEGVEEMVYPWEEETSFMREDIISDVLCVEAVLANAAKTKDDMIVVPKVVE